jgi:peptidoglycan L-alanyl-D-glutamate endopeptidase CwlK
VFNKVLVLGFDHTILCGWRNGADQHDAFLRGCSKLDYPPGGNHNKTPSQAVDAQPYPDKDNQKRWIQNQIFFAGVVVAVGATMGYKIRWGGDWDQDRDMTDENGLIDFPHYEIIN